MKRSGLTTRTWVLLIATALLVAAGALNFAQRLTRTPPPTDGVEWAQTPEGIVARSVAPDSPASRPGIFGILPGDRLVAVIPDEERREAIDDSAKVQIYLEEAVNFHNGRVTYLILRPVSETEANAYTVVLNDLRPIPNRTKRDYYVNFIGVVYLLVGLFVLFKQGARAPFVLHFAALCLTAFVFHFYKPILTYEDLDKAVAFLDSAAFVLFAPLFLHFCAVYPVRRRLSERGRWPAALLYVPGALLVALVALLYFPLEIDFLLRKVGLGSVLHAPTFSDEFIRRLYTVEFVHFCAGLIAGAAVLVRRFWKSKVAVVRQQLKWVV